MPPAPVGGVPLPRGDFAPEARGVLLIAETMAEATATGAPGTGAVGALAGTALCGVALCGVAHAVTAASVRQPIPAKRAPPRRRIDLMAHDARPAGDAYVAVCGTLPAVAGGVENSVPRALQAAIMGT